MTVLNSKWPAGVKLGVWMRLGDDPTDWHVTGLRIQQRRPLQIEYTLETDGRRAVVLVDMVAMKIKSCLIGSDLSGGDACRS